MPLYANSIKSCKHLRQRLKDLKQLQPPARTLPKSIDRGTTYNQTSTHHHPDSDTLTSTDNIIRYIVFVGAALAPGRVFAAAVVWEMVSNAILEVCLVCALACA